MSVKRIVFLHCDGPRCSDYLGEPIETETLKEARAAAQRQGWRRINRGGRVLDLCQECYELRNSEEFNMRREMWRKSTVE